MIFFILALFTVFLYAKGYKVVSLLIFFFFLTQGFKLVPEEITDSGLGISKGIDYAFFILLGILTIDTIAKQRKYFHLDAFLKYLLVFFAFLLVCIVNSKMSVGLGWSEILRTSRYQLFWLAYFVFRSLSSEQLSKVMKYLYLATFVTSILYLLQIFIGEQILLESVTLTKTILGMRIDRFYNQPDMIYFMTLMSIYYNPFKGGLKKASIIVLVLTLIGGFHRSVIGMLGICLFLGYVLKLPRLLRIRTLTITAIVVLMAGMYLGGRMMGSRTFQDLKQVMSGDIIESGFTMEDLEENATFAFRIAHVFERVTYLIDHPKAMVVGAGLIPEDSDLVEEMFDFKVGLIEEMTQNTSQLNTGDISYSILFLRLGFLGTALYLMLLIYLYVYFYKKREHPLAMTSFLYMVMTFGLSFFVSNLVVAHTFLLPLLSYCLLRKILGEMDDPILEEEEAPKQLEA